MRVILIILLFYSCKSSSQLTNNKDADSILVGKISGENFQFVIDTLSFKESISNSLFSEQTKSETYDKLEIRKSETLGEIKQEYYYIILYHFDKKLKTARYLENSRGNLYLNKNSIFNSLYNSCVGIDEKCYPHVVIKSDLTKAWICSDEVGICSIDEKECTSVRSIIQD